MRVGRKFFYDARLGSSNGEANCSVCHPAADKDDLAWDFGTPFTPLAASPDSFVRGVTFDLNRLFPGGTAGIVRLLGGNAGFNPLKGPMVVLTLRGIKDGGPMFWRGDATNDVNPDDERANFQKLNVVFEGLLGREEQLPQSDFDRLTDWVLSIEAPPELASAAQQRAQREPGRGQGGVLR